METTSTPSTQKRETIGNHIGNILDEHWEHLEVQNCGCPKVFIDHPLVRWFKENINHLGLQTSKTSAHISVTNRGDDSNHSNPSILEILSHFIPLYYPILSHVIPFYSIITDDISIFIFTSGPDSGL